MTIWIGLTGGIGSGKSQAAALFAQHGVPVLDADAINRELIDTPNSPAIVLIKQAFGEHVLHNSGSLNRTMMRDLIFRQPEAKHTLESILHPLILQEIVRQQADYANHIYGLVELPLLRPQSPFLQIIQRVLLIHCDESIRIQRVMQRNSFTEQQVKQIIANQPSDTERLALADDVLENSGSLHDLQQAVERQHIVYQQILNTQESR
ncbi:dephospho-CoA kinase [Alysiella crassa]|uniref:Dephospho-CoA kinase n=1 Tax=Alysiella crassa TaxID=153491 RepID=A0A376BK27_9NEIS|nr:dephospho-CoA kinase [Alysiella crassa]UOP07767.1 dephospho-CoA kinase [Alysiella crassa]SSY69988.1 Dephospho-CoA kinase [Alysiella crassa]